MNRMLKTIAVGWMLCLAALIAAPAAAADWSAAQQEVWKNVEAYWTSWSKGDIDGFQGYVHQDYVGWSVDSPVPSGKASSGKWMGFWAANNTVMVYEVTPVSIMVRGDFAVVHYYYSQVAKGSDGKMKSAKGRWTDILVKQGDRWVLIADNGGDADNGDD
jgi:ketosteroid isomerase-like protein